MLSEKQLFLVKKVFETMPTYLSTLLYKPPENTNQAFLLKILLKLYERMFT